VCDNKTTKNDKLLFDTCTFVLFEPENSGFIPPCILSLKQKLLNDFMPVVQRWCM